MEEEKAEDKLTILKGQRKLLYERVKQTYNKLNHARQLYGALEDKYWKQKSEFEECDRQLAMIDGRYKVIEPGRKPKKEETIQLTQSQVLDIAKKLGIEVKIEGGTNETY